MNICLDFDGVLHDHTTKPFPKMGPPVRGAVEAVCALLDAGHDITISTCRLGTQERAAIVQQGGPLRQGSHVHTWLDFFHFPDGLKVTHEKPAAHLYIDDRGLRFEGDWLATLLAVGDYSYIESMTQREDPTEEAKRRG